MPSPDTMQPDYTVLVVAYDEKARAAIALSPTNFGVHAVPCASFAEAQDYVLVNPCRGILVDLATMIKAKDAEKVVAHTLTSIFPALRVKSMGPILIPMIMAGDARQDKSLADFFNKTCAGFAPRAMRAHKRKELNLPALLGEERAYTGNVSLGGALIVHMHPERFSAGEKLVVRFLVEPGVELALEAVVVRLQRWGERCLPGIGVQFTPLDRDMEQRLSAILRIDKDSDRDRLST